MTTKAILYFLGCWPNVASFQDLVNLTLVLGLAYPLPGLEEHLEPQGGLPLHRHTVGEDISVLDQWGLIIRTHRTGEDVGEGIWLVAAR